MNIVSLFTSCDGRIGRKPYWIGWLLILLVFTLVGFAVLKMKGADIFNGPYSGASAFQLLFGALATVVSIPLMVKRLHDRDKSEHYVWPICIQEALWVAGDFSGITGNTEDINTLGWVVAAAYTAIAIWMIVELGFLRGTRGPNRFGDDPIGVPAVASAA